MPVAAFHSDQSDFEDFRQYARALYARRSPPAHRQPLRHILAVGSVYDSFQGLSVRDRDWLRATLNICAKLGVPAQEDFTYTPLLLPHDEEEDFLRPSLVLPVMPDIVTVNFIVDIDKARIADEKMLSAVVQTAADEQSFWENFKARYQGHPYLVTSPYHSPTAWYEAAQRVGARMIITFAHDCEIDRTNFLGPDFVALPEKKIPARNTDFAVEVYRADVMLRSDFHRELEAGLTFN